MIPLDIIFTEQKAFWPIILIKICDKKKTKKRLHQINQIR